MLFLFMQKGRRTWNSIEEMRKAAEEGDAQAQCYLGVCYQNGQGVKQDYHEAVKWFKRSADQNDPVAQCYLGVCYQAGLGVPQEYGQAANWFREAAEQGDPGGAIQSRRALRNRPGRPAKLCRGHEMVSRRGGTRRTAGAIQPRRFLRDRPRRPAKLSPKRSNGIALAAEQEVAPAQCNLGLCYQTGRGVEQSMPRRREVVHPRRPPGRQNRAAQSRRSLLLSGIA